MATDSTHLLPGDTSVDTSSDMSASGAEFGSVQLAAATGDAPIPVKLPQGQQVAVIRVQPGQTIELPTDSVNGLLAKLGADGNLAIVVDGRTIILQGYAEANAQSPIKIVTNDGDAVDINEVIVATNPDIALDIQTAAGPAAGAQGGTDGADAAGSGIFVPFAEGPLLGGFDPAGVLKATQLAYKNIDDERVEFVVEEEEAEEAPNGTPSAVENAVVRLDDDDVSGAGNPGFRDDTTDGADSDDVAPLNVTGTLGHDYGSDGPGTLLLLDTSALPAGFTAALSDGGKILTISQNGTPVLKVTLADETSGNYTAEQLAPIIHPDGNEENNLQFDIAYQVKDSNGDTAEGHLTIDVDDDSPTLTLDVEGEALPGLVTELDETVGDDRYAAGEAADGGNTDDAGPGLAQVKTNVPGGLSALFAVGGDVGSDIPGTLTDSLKFIGIPGGGLLTDLSATNGGAITLFANGATVIEGKDTTDQVVFRIEIVEVNPGEFQLVTTLFEALEHGDITKFDENVVLTLDEGLVQLQYEVTRTDEDGDFITESAEIDLISEESSYFSFDDDGPTLTVDPSTQGTGGLVTELDETVGDDRYAAGEAADGGNTDDAGPGLAQVKTNVPGGLSALFAVGGDVGSDIPGTLTDSLKFIGIPGGGLLTDLSATNGGAITLFANGATVIEGKDTTDQVVFRIEIVEVNPGEFQLVTTLFEALEHGDITKFDENVVLTLDEGLVQLQYEVTRTDEDGDSITESAEIDLISEESSYFSFDDDGPTLTVDPSTQGTGGLVTELDETVGDDRYAAGEAADGGNTDDAGPGLAQVKTNVPGGLSALFAVGGDVGSDIPGTLTDSLKFIGIPGGGLLTDLSATNGGAITLFANGATVIEGKDTTDQVVFRIEIVEVNPGEFQLVTTLFEALEHGDITKFDENVVLTLDEGLVQLQYEVTRTDEDGDSITESAEIDLISEESSYFSFDDDGPTLTVDPSTQGTGGLTVELDETVGDDRYAAGEAADGGNTDDAGPGLAQVKTNVPGGLSALFAVGGDVGSDIPGTLTDSLKFIGIPGGGLLTDLSATNGGAITLFANGATVIEGKDTTDQVVFRIEIVEVNPGEFQLVTTLFEALEHGDITKFDENVVLTLDEGLVQLQYEVTRTDEDGDSITESAEIDLISEESSYFSFDDDGPTLTVDPSTQGTGGLVTELDETVGDDRYAAGEAADGGNTDDAGPGLAQVKTNVPGGLSALFAVGGDVGSDIPGTLTDSLKFIGIPGGGLLTDLSATNGGAITLFANGATVIEGKDTTDQVVFRIEIVEVNPGEFQLVTTLFEALEHGDITKFDENVVLTLDEGLVQLQYEVTRTDEDGDSITESAEIDLISEESSYFSFDDDGPTLTVDPSTQGTGGLTVELDETVGDDRYAAGEAADGGNTDDAGPGLAQVKTNVPGGLSALFAVGGDVGSDIPGTLTDSLKFIGIPGGGLLTDLSATNGGAITLFANGATVIEGKDTTDQVVFRIEIVEVNPGEFQLVTTLFEALEHGDITKFDENVVLTLDEGLVQLQYEVTRTDEDGDSITESAEIDLISEESSYFSFDDDGPTAGVVTDLDVLDDEGLAGGIKGGTDDVAGELTSTGGTLTFDFGSDGPGEVSFANLDNTQTTLGSETIDLVWDDATDTLTGSSAGRGNIFTIVVNPLLGTYTFTLLKPVMHTEIAGENDALLSLAYLVTDGDGDEVTGTLNITIDDDTPVDISPVAAELENKAGSSDTEDLDFIGNVGADLPGTIVFDGDGSDGDQLFGSIGGGSEALTSGDNPIYLFGFGSGTLTATTDINNADPSAVVFTIALDPIGDTYTINMVGTIDNGAGIVFDTFPSGGAGLREWLGVPDPDPTGDDQDLLITGGIPGTTTVNNDSDDIGANNQFVNPSEGLRLDFVSGLNVGGDTSDITKVDYDTHYTVNDVGVTLVQVQGAPGSLCDVQINVYDADDDINFIGDAGDVKDTITEIRVLDGSGIDVTSLFTDLDTANFNVTFNPDGSVKVEDLGLNYQVFVSTADGFNRLEIFNAETPASGNDAFAIGGIEVGTAQSGDPIDMSFDLTVKDFDGDQSVGAIDVTLMPEVVI